MAQFSNNSITEIGRLLLADVQAGGQLQATKIVIGSGYIPGGKTARTMTTVVAPVKELVINKKERTNDGKVIYGGAFSNRDITTAFYFREFALFARVIYRAEDGTITRMGDEALYSYGNAGASADLIPAYSTTTVVEKQMDLVTYVGNDTAVDMTIESGVYATQDQLAEEIAKSLDNIDCGFFTDTPSPVAVHNALPTAHSTMNVDGNVTESSTVVLTLEEHVIDEQAHQNLLLDGNN